MVTGFLKLIRTLLEPIPQYVVGCLLAITIVGASPSNKLRYKLIWLFRCLSCPFIGVFAAINIGGDELSRCIFWLLPKYFVIKGTSTSPEYRPVGFYTMKVSENQDKAFRKKIELCTAKALVIERFSTLVSVYYIIVGIIAGVSRVLETVLCQDWPYISILLSWTISALCRRAFSKNLVVKDSKKIFKSSDSDIDIE
ncbi:4143_t:CDS:1, partial [Racocetra persica]